MYFLHYHNINILLHFWQLLFIKLYKTTNKVILLFDSHSNRGQRPENQVAEIGTSTGMSSILEDLCGYIKIELTFEKVVMS